MQASEAVLQEADAGCDACREAHNAKSRATKQRLRERRVGTDNG